MADQLRRDRKYKSFWAVFLMSSVLLAFEKLSGSEWVTVVMAVFAAYMAGNGFEHWAKRGNS